MRVPYTASLTDLYATLIELGRGQTPGYITGSPLITADGKVNVESHRAAYSDLDNWTHRQDDWDAAITHGRFKTSSTNARESVQIFDRVLDPLEQRNLLRSKRLDIGRKLNLVSELHETVTSYEKLRDEFGPPEWIESEDGLQEELHALGYV